jgi:hypothetical protein
MRDLASRGRAHFRESLEEVGRESFERKHQYTNSNPGGSRGGQVTERIRVNVIDGPGEDVGAADLRVPLRHKRLYFKRLERRRRDHKSCRHRPAYW